jgi:uncharacterized protein
VRAERSIPADVDRRIAELVRGWAGDPDVAAVYLFGSRARGDAIPRSDVDLAIVLRDGLDPTARWRKRLHFSADAARHLRTDAVDVIVLDDAPTTVAHRVLAHGKILAETDPRRRTRVAERIMRQYLDEEHLRAVLDAGLSRRLREGRFGR